MHICWVTINVSDIEKSIEFYRDLAGMKLARRMQPAPGVDIAFMEAPGGGAEIELMKNDRNPPPVHGNDIFMGLSIESVDDKLDELKNNGFTDIDGPYQPVPFTRFFFIHDPDGVRLQFVESINS